MKPLKESEKILLKNFFLFTNSEFNITSCIQLNEFIKKFENSHFRKVKFIQQIINS